MHTITIVYQHIRKLSKNKSQILQNCVNIITICMLFGCAQHRASAPIEYNNHAIGSVAIMSDEGEIITGDDSGKSDADHNHSASGHFVSSNDSERYKIIYHEVQVGESIENIAAQYQQSTEDIISLNNLSAPYYLDEFQIIKIKIANQLAEHDEINDVIQSSTKPQEIPAVIQEFIPPIKGNILVKFGAKTKYGVNKGINISAKQGTKVLATASGKVIYADYDATFGYLVIIKIKDKNIITSYAHLEDIILNKGVNIAQGDVIGYVGKTGKVDKSQLHFGIREGKVAKNPLKYINYAFGT